MTASDKSNEVLRALTKLAQISALSINELRIILALERVVARLEAHNGIRDKLIFKGGFVLQKALASPRFTRDLDALAAGIPKEEIASLVWEALQVDLNDGLYFAEPDIEDLIDQGQYGGLRIKIPFQIGALPTEPHKLKKLSRVHLDIGFGDVISGRARRLALVPLIEGEKPISWNIYPLESIFAEKLETLVSRGSANSRGKDLYDLIIIFESVGESESLCASISKTFLNRSTAPPESFSSFFQGLDLTILRNSWRTVGLQSGEMSIEECERKLRHVLERLDKLFDLRES